MQSKEALWNRCLVKIEQQILPENYVTWFTPTYPHSLNNGAITIAVPNDFYKKCLTDNYLDLIEFTLENISDKKVQVQFLVDPDCEEKSKQLAVEKINQPEKIEINNIASSINQSLNPKYLFSNFIVGSSNQFAHAAAKAVAGNPAMAYNPLFIYGSVGLGKTHLLHAIGNEIVQKNRDARVRYLSAESFTVDLIESLKREDMPTFRQRYRPLDVLLVDDIQFIAGKERTQEEFFYTFNALYESHKQVILSCDKYPKAIHNMEDRLRSRFESGLVADINFPDLETKVAILHKKAEFHGKTLPHDVAMFLASNIKSNIRELEGLLLRIIAYSSFTQRDINLALSKEVLKEFTFDKTKNFNIPNIMKTVAFHFHIKVSDIKSKRRSRDISIPRQIAMYLCREYTTASLPDIGKQFGGKDHTTVMFAHKKMVKIIKENNELSNIVQNLIEKIESD